MQISLSEFYKSLDFHPEVVVEAKRRLEITEEERQKILGKLKNKQKEDDELKKQVLDQ